eukprot:scaffold8943_cov54-Cylindrotheca_fusiformis.AAC.2
MEAIEFTVNKSLFSYFHHQQETKGIRHNVQKQKKQKQKQKQYIPDAPSGRFICERGTGGILCQL